MSLFLAIVIARSGMVGIVGVPGQSRSVGVTTASTVGLVGAVGLLDADPGEIGEPVHVSPTADRELAA